MKKFENPEIEILVLETEPVTADLSVYGVMGIDENTFDWR